MSFTKANAYGGWTWLVFSTRNSGWWLVFYWVSFNFKFRNIKFAHHGLNLRFYTPMADVKL